MKFHLRYAGAATLVLLLAACGGAESLLSEEQPETPVPRSAPPAVPSELSFTYTAKAVQFSWRAPEGATHFEILQDPDGPSGPLPAVLVASTTEPALPYAVALKARFEPDATYAVRACHDTECSATSATVRPDLAATVGFLKKYRAINDDYLGMYVAISADGRTLVAATPDDAHASAGIFSDPAADLGPLSLPKSGAVVVYARASATGPWRQQAVIKPLNPSADSYFGASVALSADGNSLAVGAPYESSGGGGITQGVAGPVNNLAPYSGAAYIFTRSGEAWSEQAYFKGDTANLYDAFGVSVAISGDGNNFAVGASGDDRSADEGGAVYLYSKLAGTWARSTVLVASNPDQYDMFGYVVALSADGATLAASAARESGGGTAPLAGSVDELTANNNAVESGAVYVFTRSAPGSWAQQAYVKGSRSAEYVGFGVSISLSADGSAMAIGAPWDSRLHRDTAASSANDKYGAAYVFTRSGVTWTEQAYLKAVAPAVGSEFGMTLSLSADGDTLAVASPYDSSAATGLNGDETDRSVDRVGAVHVFQRAAGAWARRAYVKPPAATRYLSFGYGLALSGDGAVMAVGAMADGAADLKDPSVAKPNSGAVYLY